MPLYDHLGRPVSTAALKTTEAVAQTSGMRSVWTGQPANGLTPQRLAGILRAAEGMDVQSYLELAEQMEERDAHYLSVLGTRKRAVTRLPFRVEAASDSARDIEIADFIETFLKRDALRAENFDILDALGKGFSVTEIIWDTSGGQWMPERLERVDQRWFDIDPVDGRTLSLRGEATRGQPLTPFKYLVHEHPAKSGLPIRGGLARPAAWSWMFKNYATKDWVAFAEVYGMPMRIGKYGPGATTAEIATLMAAVADMGSDAAAVIPQSMMIELIEGAGNAGPEMFEKLFDKMDQQMSKLVLGQTATTDAVPGKLGSGTEHSDVREDIRDADADQLATTLNIQLVRPMVDLNYGPQKGYPRICIGLEDAVDLKLLADALQIYVPLGLEVEESVIRDRLGLPEPKAGAKLLTAPQPSQEPPAAPGALPSPKKGAQAAPEASKGFSGGKDRASDPAAAAAQDEGDDDDTIAALADELAGDGDWFARPIASAALALLDEAGDLETFRARLAELIDGEGTGPVAERLGQATFTTFLAGASGQPTRDNGTDQ
ncbi:MAG: DUF935 family protein [Caulobacter sp.]|nr:DUF935 family protein [Caulobacter sp.]